MKRTRIVALLFSVVLPLCVLAQKADKAKKGAAGGGAEAAISSYLDQSRQAALKGDASFAETNYADDYVRVGPTGEVMTKADFVNALKSGDLKYESIEPSDVKIRTYGNTAVVTAKAAVKGTNKGQDISGSYRSTRVLVNRGGKWQEVSFHTTKVAE